jgi:hypothetical protein
VHDETGDLSLANRGGVMAIDDDVRRMALATSGVIAEKVCTTPGRVKFTTTRRIGSGTVAFAVSRQFLFVELTSDKATELGRSLIDSAVDSNRRSKAIPKATLVSHSDRIHDWFPVTIVVFSVACLIGILGLVSK